MVDNRTLPAAALAAPCGDVDLAELDPAAMPIGPHSKSAAKRAVIDLSERLVELQSRLLAQGKSGSRRRVLLILQGMDTCGKDGVIKHVLGGLNPVGVRVASFEKPTRQDLAHHFLWRIKQQLPGPGIIGAFNRSHYEDVLVPRVHGELPAAVLAQRYDDINSFERRLSDDGVLLVKCFLHISPAVQEKRLLARLGHPRKSWKYDPQDVTERAHWDSYQHAYNDALTVCRSPAAPWSIIPSDRKWYRNWAVAALLTQRLRDLDLRYPLPPADTQRERERIIATRVDVRSATGHRRSKRPLGRQQARDAG
jgi:PPK2 family polyphosphate:nucleotide phosphotransferase